jgi:hypothetical protein
MEYKFKQLKLTDVEKLWLKEIHKANFAKIDTEVLQAKLWGQLPEDFDPSKIDSRLICDNRLTLIGLWYVEPQNALFGHIERIAKTIRELILESLGINDIKAKEIASIAGIPEKEAEIALRFLFDLQGFFGSGEEPSDSYGMTQVSFPQTNRYQGFLKFKNLEQTMEDFFIRHGSFLNMKNKKITSSPFQQNLGASFGQQDSRDTWKDIQSNFDISKLTLAKKINFVTDKHKKGIILRDIEHAYILANLGFSKPAVILAGGVIEELLRLYLEHKKIRPPEDKFVEYVKTCEQNKLLKSGISKLSDSVRQFRNLIHLVNEKTKTHTISKSAAKGAVASIFTIANDFQKTLKGDSRP